MPPPRVVICLDALDTAAEHASKAVRASCDAHACVRTRPRYLTSPKPKNPQALLEVIQLFLFQRDEGGQPRFNDVQLALSRAPSGTVDLEPQDAERFLRALHQPADEAMRKEGEAVHATVAQELAAFTAAAAAPPTGSAAVAPTTGSTPAAGSTVVVVISSSVEETFPVPVEVKDSILHKVRASPTLTLALTQPQPCIGPMA
jgi:hypothetical protein